MKLEEFSKLIQIINQLRDPNTGCSWNLEQTHHSLVPYLIEETYECIEALKKNDHHHSEEELGDLLLQILLHAKIGEEKSQFNIESISKKLSEKLIRRHPHIFQSKKKISSSDVEKNWEKIKSQEKNTQDQSEIPSKYLHAPSLTSAYNIGKKTNDLKFDWENFNQVSYKVEEEWQELKEELVQFSEKKLKNIEEELGDLLFSVAQLSRHLNLDPEQTLQKANLKFLKRFHLMEKMMKQENASFGNLNQKQLDVYWDQVKKNEKN